jgi:organic radical activating enzyme
MYLQITTKCNMKCAHCCYSCGRNGKHMEYGTVIDAEAFIRDRDEMITIGGGEPTLHPRFFDILQHCLNDFDYVWMATNGSQTNSMYRLADIIDGCDTGDIQDGNPYDRDEEEEAYYEWQDEHANPIYQEGKLTVALSQDCFHDHIDQRIVDRWTKAAIQHKRTGYEIRNVTQSHDGVSAQGRAKRTGSGWGEHCVCSDMIIIPGGKIKMCGCGGAPVVGDVWRGIDEKWQGLMEGDKFRNTGCWRGVKGEVIKIKRHG